MYTDRWRERERQTDRERTNISIPFLISQDPNRNIEFNLLSRLEGKQVLRWIYVQDVWKIMPDSFICTELIIFS